MDSSHCSDCNGETTTIDDLQSGDTICSECGLIIESRYIDSTSEWRTFANDGGENKDRSRVGEQNNPLLDRTALETVIADTKKSNSAGGHFKLKRHAQSNADRNLIKGFKIIRDLAERLSVDRGTENRSCEILKIVDENKLCKGRNSTAVFAAAALFTACKESGVQRTLREIAAVSEGEIQPKDINKAAEVIKNLIEVETATSGGSGASIVRRFCGKIGLGHEATKAVHEAVERAGEIDVRRNPLSILAGIIYMICEIKGKKVPIKDLAGCVQVKETTIKKVVKELFPFASRLIPDWFAGEEQIKMIICPCNKK